MSVLAQAGIWLAQQDQYSMIRAMRQGLEEKERSGSLTAMLVGLAIVVALGGLIVLVERLRRRRSPQLDYLARAATQAGLAQSELRDLRLLASRAQLAHPAAMLLTPANLAFAAHQAARETHDPALQKRLNRLSMRMFGERLPEVAEADAGGV